LEVLTLRLTYSRAKSLQWVIALGKIHIKEGSETIKELEDIEKELEEFTNSTCLAVP